jgi:hypothetical protein
VDAELRRRLNHKRELLLRRLATITDIVRGSVVLMKRPCTYPGCRKCASGERHPTWVLTYSRGGKTRTVYLGKGRQAQARRMVAQYRLMTELIEQLCEINLSLLIDKVPDTQKETRDGKAAGKPPSRERGGRPG